MRKVVPAHDDDDDHDDNDDDGGGDKGVNLGGACV